MQKFIYYSSMVVIAAAVLLACQVIFWMAYPYSVDDYITWKIPKNIVLNKVLREGEQIKWQVDLFVKQPLSVVTSRSIKSREAGCDFKTLETSTMVLPVGQRKYTNVSYRVPEGFTPCTYHIELVSTVHVNPVRDLIFIRESEDFKVI